METASANTTVNHRITEFYPNNKQKVVHIAVTHLSVCHGSVCTLSVCLNESLCFVL